MGQAFLVSFYLAGSWLVRKGVVGFRIEMRSWSPRLWLCPPVPSLPVDVAPPARVCAGLSPAQAFPGRAEPGWRRGASL